MNALILFAKYPDPGSVKTRLGNEVGMDNAAEIQKKILLDLVDLHKDKKYDFFIATPTGSDKERIEKITHVHTILQKGDNLGEKMHDMFARMLEKYDHVIIIGSDTPDIDSSDILNAFNVLDKNDTIVIGPAHDGGYYLIGMSKPYNIFSDVDWSTEKVLSQTLSHSKSIGLQVHLLETRYDIDTLAELNKYPFYKEYLEELQKR